MKANSCEIDFNESKYVLTFDRKAILTKDGKIFEGTVKGFLRDLIAYKRLDIPLTNKKGNELNTHTLAQDVIKYYSNRSLDPQKMDKEVVPATDTLSGGAPRKPVLTTTEFAISHPIKGKTLIILNCSSSKKRGGESECNQDYFDNSTCPEIIAFKGVRNRLIGLLSNPQLNIIENDTALMKAYERYNGHFFRAIDWNRIESKIQEGCLQVVIVSALFGVIEYNRTIPYYDLKITQVNCWGSSIQESINCYVADKGIQNVYSFLSGDYAHLLRNRPHFRRRRGSNQGYIGGKVNKIVEKIEC